ncbi:NAD(P)-dependent oxidoreductase [Brachyspira hyodysenteriae]|uniref:SDR family NAD(P)-dependent oxidoreductase n=1 Tax=Brachyspira hyodysenteriae TaxID=159 RepID=UPI00063DA3C4|nr:SDR family NAD(P)-dependent oxidoreductase [Brachyspira hyodysenteriae]KLI28334.1 L-allo-threonine dehydrogenase [Brachyspira hyodysenteriae]TVL77377.1 NAD(P)-dependent oxidoreductase [Brachyspira hyodysenteriae]TVL88729.1 NAD(P)-dependent oxidoreductase [Brachyspira hyodysenteriae]
MYIENIKGRTAFVSGASAGIGEAVAKMLASNGVNLILAARRIEKLEALKNELENNHNVKVKVIQLDFSKSEDIVKAIDSLKDEDKKIDILINNAGLALGKDLYYNNPIEDSLQMIRVNCEGLIVLTRLLLPYILESKHGHIVNLSSTAADEAYSGGAIYCATKSFVEMFGDSLRVELIDKPVKITNIKPGAVNTEFSTVRFKGDKEKADNVYKGFNPLYAEDIADNIEYALTRKSHVQISSMTIMAENQGSATIIHKNK